MNKERRFPVLEGARDISLICAEKMNELYGDPCLDEIGRRLTDELRVINENNYGSIYMIFKLLLDKASRNGRPTEVRGPVGSSFAAFLLGITAVNPLLPHYHCKDCRCVEFVPGVASGFDLPDKPCSRCGKSMIGDGHNIPFEVFSGMNSEKEPHIVLNVTDDMRKKAKELLQEIFPNDIVIRPAWRDDETGQLRPYSEWMVIPREYAADAPMEYIGEEDDQEICIPHKKMKELYRYDCYYYHQEILNHSSLGALYKLSSETGVPLKGIPMNNPKVFETVYASGDTYGISEFDNDFGRHMMKLVNPKAFSDLVRISGISHGIYPWSEWDKDTEENFIPSELPPLSEIIAFRDDIMVYLMGCGVDRAAAYKVMECVRKGKAVSAELRETMSRAGVPDRYGESYNRIHYLCPKAQSVGSVMNSVRLAWFKVHHPVEFQKVMEYTAMKYYLKNYKH